MKLKSITIQNFMSIRNITLDLEDRGLVLLNGKNLDNESLNNNGAGKSSIIEALVYALYGKTLRGLKGDAVVHRIPKKNMKVFLDIEDDDGSQYRIARYRKHSTNKNKSFLYRNGRDITPKSESEFNTYVANLLQADYLTFTSSLLYSAESFKFTSATDSEIKSTFDTVLGLDIYQKCQDIAKMRLKEIDSVVSTVEWKVDDRKSRIDELNSKIIEVSVDRDRYEDEQSKKYDELTIQLGDLDKRIETAKNELLNSKIAFENAKSDKENAEEILVLKSRRMKEVDELKDALQDVKDELREHERNIRNYHRSIEDSSDEINSLDSKIVRIYDKINDYNQKKLALDDGIGSPCPTCGRALTIDCLEPAKKEYEDKIAELMSDVESLRLKICELNSDIETYQSKIKNEQNDIDELESVQSEFNFLIKKSKKIIDEKEESEKNVQYAQNQYYMAEADVRVADKNLKHIKSQRDDVKKMIQEMTGDNPYDKILAGYRSEQDTYQTEVKQLLDSVQEQLDERDCLIFWQKAYSNQGIKSLILDDITPFLNRRANKYLSKLTSGHIEVKFNTQTTLKSGETRERFSIDIINHDGGQEYSANSGGERKRIDLAINLAMQDLVASRSNKKINVAIFDEAFDTLDEVGVEKVIELLQELSEEKSSIFVISHNEHLKSYFTNVISVVKENGFSTLESGVEPNVEQ